MDKKILISAKLALNRKKKSQNFESMVYGSWNYLGWDRSMQLFLHSVEGHYKEYHFLLPINNIKMYSINIKIKTFNDHKMNR